MNSPSRAKPGSPRKARSRASTRMALDECLADFDRRYDAAQTGVTVLCTDFFMAHLRDLYSAFDGDLHAALVLGEIGHTTTRRFTEAARHDALELRALESADLAPMVRPCNALSVSHACGMPRETVRRKVAALAARGWIAQVEGGWVATAAAGDHFKPEFNRLAARRLLETARKLLDVLDDD